MQGAPLVVLATNRATARVASSNDEVFVGDLFAWEKLTNEATIFVYAEGSLLAVRSAFRLSDGAINVGRITIP